MGGVDCECGWSRGSNALCVLCCAVGRERAAVESAYAALTEAQRAHCGALERANSYRWRHGERHEVHEAEAERLGVEREQVRERFYAVRAAWVAAGSPGPG